MRIFLFGLVVFCCLFVFEGCHTSKKSSSSSRSQQHIQTAPKPVSRRTGKQPKFIANMYMDHHNRNSAMVNAVQPHRLPEKKVSRLPQDRPQPVLASASPKELYAVNKSYAIPVSFSKKEARGLSNKYAELLGARPSDIDNTTLYSFVDRWVGTHYRLGGCDKSGIDCSGFARKLYEEVYGIDLLRTSTEQFKNCKRIKNIKDAEEGDLIFFKAGTRHISHVGVYLANDYFVHASTSSGVIISSLHEDYWERSYAGIGRVPVE